MRTDLIRKTALTAAGLAFTGGAIAGPVTMAYAASDAKPASQTQTDRKNHSERELGVRYEAQPNFYYCGPAATRNALSVQGKNINVAKQTDTLRTDIVRTVDDGRAVVANIAGTTTDTDGTVHSFEGGHYISVVGYRDNGNTVKIADSADPNMASYWISVEHLADWIATRGYSTS
ncbi:C39 family peptidase [Micromonospora chokoriensis]|uniref:C39 family peptidase n=1 Tax=Micromonospora chokoriensis TaxID=356851 RepID=UPI0004C35ABD|nr:C39 family peptidase [Micromonospora chokoriensis]